MTRSQRLKPVARIADRKQQDAARLFRLSREELEHYRQRLVQMQLYRQDYLARFQESGSRGMSGEQVKDFQIFLGKLDDGISQLRSLIEDSTKSCEINREDWVARRARCQALDGIIEHYRLEEARDTIRREERASDERSQGVRKEDW